MHPSRILAAFVAALALTLPGALLAKSLYIEQWGEDSPTCGSRNEPCESIYHAIGWRAGPNDRLIVGPGEYVGDLVVDENQQGVKLHGLTLESTAGRRATRIVGAGSTHVIESHVERFRLGRRGKGFTITESPAINQTLVRLFYADKNRIESNLLLDGDMGARVYGSHVVIQDNIFYTQYGIVCPRCSYTRIKNNRIHEPFFEAIRLGDSSGENTKAEVIGNLVTGQSGANDSAILIAATADHYRLMNNVVVNSAGYGVRVQGTRGARITGNIVVGTNFTGIDVTENNDSEPYLVANNHIEGGNTHGLRITNFLNGKLISNSSIDNGQSGLYVQSASGPVDLQSFNLFGNGDGCGIYNNSNQSVAYKKVFFGEAGGVDSIADNDGHDSVCGGISPIGTHSARQVPVRVNKARLL